MAPMMNKPAPSPRPVKATAPAKAVVMPPRLKPTSTREYGKGGQPLSQYPNVANFGAGIGYGGPQGV